jgi:hypothetical protein
MLERRQAELASNHAPPPRAQVSVKAPPFDSAEKTAVAQRERLDRDFGELSRVARRGLRPTGNACVGRHG